MNIAVLGATGFLGSWAARALVARGHAVTALARDSSDAWRLDGVDVELVRAPSSDWPAALTGIRADVVLNAAWSGVVARDRDDERLQAANVAAHDRLVRAAYSSGAARFVGVGSQAEFGPTSGPVLENSALAPASAYGRAKVAAAAALAAAAAETGGQWSWARVFSVYGPLETGAFVLPSIARAAAAGETIALSSGRQRWSYLFAADAGDALAELVVHPDATGAYSVAHPDAPVLRETLTTFAAGIGSPATVQFGKRDGASLEASVERLTALGWQPRWPLADGLRMTADWMSGAAVADPFDTSTPLPPQR